LETHPSESFEKQSIAVDSPKVEVKSKAFPSATIVAVPETSDAVTNTNTSNGSDNNNFDDDDDMQPPYPLSFACPITNELMSEPVIVIESRMVYERVAIESWFSKSSTDPMTNVALVSKVFIPVLAFKEAIEEWKEMHNYRDH
jgi:hypothetical protein